MACYESSLRMRPAWVQLFPSSCSVPVQPHSTWVERPSLLPHTSQKADLCEVALEAAPIGGQLFTHDTSRNDCAAISLLLDTYATRLLAQALNAEPKKGRAGGWRILTPGQLSKHPHKERSYERWVKREFVTDQTTKRGIGSNVAATKRGGVGFRRTRKRSAPDALFMGVRFGNRLHHVPNTSPKTTPALFSVIGWKVSDTWVSLFMLYESCGRKG
jgi:hypothetical protein